MARTMADSNIFNNIPKPLKNNIEKVYSKVKANTDEFEIMIKNYKSDNKITSEQFLQIIKYIKYRKSTNQQYSIIQSNTLDISYGYKRGVTYRISIDGIKEYNKHLEILHERKNHIIFKSLLKMSKSNPKITVIKKTKSKDNIVDIDDYDVRVRLSKENEISNSEFDMLNDIDQTANDNIIFRMKQRISLVLDNKNNKLLSIDATFIRQETNVHKIKNGTPTYELELDFNSDKKPDTKYLETMFIETTKLLKVLQQTNYLITHSEKEKVLKDYMDSMFDNEVHRFYARNSFSLGIQNVVDQLSNRYAVTDKADGERYMMIVNNKNVYLLNSNLEMKKTGIELKTTEYNGTVLDGEYIFLKNKNKYIYLIFDCLYYKDKDIRNESNFMARLDYADDVVEKIFVEPKHKYHKIKKIDSNFSIDNILKHHNEQIEKFMKSLNHDIDISNKLLIRRKYFIDSNGIQDNEIYKYSVLLWQKYVIDKEKIKCPYILDGLVYHPLVQKYTLDKKESKFVEYKWKPQDKNSIDFFISFEKDETGNSLVLFDNSTKDQDISENGYQYNKPYKIAKLYVGRSENGVEKPVLFEGDHTRNTVHLFLENGEIRDIEGNVIQDHTVVEFYYDNNLDTPEKQRWVPMRTRYDKTESIQRFGKKFGNYETIANSIWQSIKNPFTINDLEILSNDKQYISHINLLRSKIDHTVILSTSRENAYKREMKYLQGPSKNFTNFIMSSIFYTHFNSDYNDQVNTNILDLDCGRGEHLMQFYYSRISSYVGINSDINSITSGTDGAVSRYNRLRNNHDNFPKMTFVHADLKVPLTIESQQNTLGATMSDSNSELISNIFDNKNSKKFDRMLSLFSIDQYLLSDDSWNNFLDNVNKMSEKNTYLIVMCIDAEQIMNKLKDKDQYTQFYTNKNGEKKILFDIVKKYDTVLQNVKTGNTYDFFNSFTNQENVYDTKYLVSKDFLENSFKKRCNMDVIETDLYSNQYNILEDFLTHYFQYEQVKPTREGIMTRSSKFYENTDINQAAKDLIGLYRFYILKKNEDVQKGGRIIQITEQPTLTIKDFLDPNKYIVRNLNNNDYQHSFIKSMYDVLKTSNKIPNIPLSDFLHDFDINVDLYDDNKITNDIIKQLSKMLVIGSTVESNSEHVDFDGFNLLIFEPDCNGSDIDAYCHRWKKKLSNNVPTMMFMKNNSTYNPIYRKYGKNYLGLFDTSSKLINRILSATKFYV